MLSVKMFEIFTQNPSVQCQQTIKFSFQSNNIFFGFNIFFEDILCKPQNQNHLKNSNSRNYNF